jgi:hypothetical protein
VEPKRQTIQKIAKSLGVPMEENMDNKTLILWFSVVSTIGVLWGIVFSFFGLGILPIVSPKLLVPWSNGVYGATLIGLCATFFFVGRHAFRNNDAKLMKALLKGIFVWLVIEGAFSLYYGVYLNVGVDMAVLVLLSFPLIKGIRALES